MCEREGTLEDLGIPAISVVTITLDDETDDITVDIGEWGILEALGLLRRVIGKLEEEAPPVRLASDADRM